MAEPTKWEGFRTILTGVTALATAIIAGINGWGQTNTTRETEKIKQLGFELAESTIEIYYKN